MKPGVVPAGVVPDPLALVDVGSLWMSGSIGEMAFRRRAAPTRLRRGGVTNRRGAVAGWFAGSEAAACSTLPFFALAFFLGERPNANSHN